LDQSNFSLLRERLIDTDVARPFFNAVWRKHCPPSASRLTALPGVNYLER